LVLNQFQFPRELVGSGRSAMSDGERKVGIYIRVTGPRGGAGGSGISIEQPDAAMALAELAALVGEERAKELMELLKGQLLRPVELVP